MSIDIVGWIGTVLIMFGYYFNAKKIKKCFLLLTVGNRCPINIVLLI